MEYRTTVAQALSSAICARLSCERSGNNEWFHKHEERVAQLAKDYLPSGCGIDAGCYVDLDKSTGEKIVIVTSYHHMNDAGSYDGWTEHVVTVRPSFRGFDISISGRNRNEIKDYLADTFHSALSTEIAHR